MHNSLFVTKFIQDKIDKISSKGITVTIKYNFDELYDLQGKLAGKEISPLFDKKHFDFSPENAFWLEGKDVHNNIVHIQAMKITSIGKFTRLSDVLTQQLSRAFGPIEKNDKINFCPAAETLTGQMVYHGDMWLSSTCRGLGLGDTLGQLGMALIYNQWQPDYIYAFLEGGLSKTGYPFRQGYWNYQPLNSEWKLAYPWLYQEDWLIWMSRDDLAYLMQIDHQKIGKEQRQQPRSQNALETASENKKSAA